MQRTRAMLMAILIGVGCWLAWELHLVNAFLDEFRDRVGWQD